MGREFNGVRVEYSKSPCVKVKPKVSANSDKEVNPKSLVGNSELKDCEVKECTSEVSMVKSTNFETENPDMKSSKAEDQKLRSDNSSVGPSSNNSKMAVYTQTNESATIETPASPNPSNSKSPDSTRKSQPTTPVVARKPFDDDDNWSIASSTRTTRSRTTVAVAPSFNSTERLERRKEYYAKLEEKRKALEAERREYEARTKEDEEAAIKQLRKNMMYRANPVPSFYYEKPPPKKELKKLPTTRAVSPKLGRRKSCNDAVCTSPSEEKICGRAIRRSSLGSQREISTQSSNLKKKDPLAKDRVKQVKETTKRNTPPKVTKQTNANIAVKS